MLSKSGGIVLVCDSDGYITKVLNNDFDWLIINPEKKLFSALFVSEDIRKSFEFFLDIKTRTSSFGWELTIGTDNTVATLYFGGIVIDERVFIFASEANQDYEKMFLEMVKINNEQTNMLREAARQNESDKATDDQNSIYYFDEISRLNNELVDTQRELTRKNAELAELNELKNQFIGMAAHDLRNPLSMIYHYITFIQDDLSNLSDDQREFIDQIKSINDFMLKLVNDILDISSIESGKLSLNSSEFDLIEFMNHIIELNRIFSRRKSIAIKFLYSGNKCYIDADKNKLEQVFNNLLTNSVKYSESNTTITVTVETDEKQALISVLDEGQGVAEQEIAAMFEPFVKTSAKNLSEERSTGLGLTIVKNIISAHKGKIWAESEQGSWTKISFTLPIIRSKSYE